MKIPMGPGELTTKWLSDALRETGTLKRARVTSFVTQIMGDEEGLTGSGQMARLQLAYDQDEANAPRTLIAKFSSPDSVLRAEFHSYELYEREVRFYQELAHQVELRTPICYYSALDRESGHCVLLLEDLAPVRSGGDNYALCSFEEADLAMRAIAKFHATWWESPKLAELTWLRRGAEFYKGFHEAYQQRWEPFLHEVGHMMASPIIDLLPNFFH